jgi:hypothetical protein
MIRCNWTCNCLPVGTFWHFDIGLVSHSFLSVIKGNVKKEI